MVSVNAIVIDPEVPEGPKRRLAAADSQHRTAPRHSPYVQELIAFGAPTPLQPRLPRLARLLHTAAARQTATDAERKAQRMFLAMSGMVVGTLAVQPVEAPLVRALLVTLCSVAALATGRVMTIALALHSREAHQLDNAAVLFHRQYVCPPRDFDAQARPAWHAAVAAANQVAHSDVVRMELIDSVRVKTVLPYLLWDIAERLARLSALRRRHRAILNGVRADDPEVAAVLAPQRQAHELAAQDIARRVRYLEAFAERVTEADTAQRREEAVRQLGRLNDIHRDLLARVGDERSADPAILSADQASDVQAVIDQANEAVRQANEAGRSLAPLPGQQRVRAE